MEYHELNPLIRGRELELLSNETFERMIQTNYGQYTRSPRLF